MKKQIGFWKTIFISLLVLSAATIVCAQKGTTATRLKFGRGATALTATGNLNGYRDRQVFVVRLRAGQSLTAEQIKRRNSTRYVSVSILNPAGKDETDYDASCNSNKTVSPTVAGDYRIVVVECRKADAWRGAFRLKITVR